MNTKGLNHKRLKPQVIHQRCAVVVGVGASHGISAAVTLAVV